MIQSKMLRSISLGSGRTVGPVGRHTIVRAGPRTAIGNDGRHLRHLNLTDALDLQRTVEFV